MRLHTQHPRNEKPDHHRRLPSNLYASNAARTARRYKTLAIQVREVDLMRNAQVKRLLRLVGLAILKTSIRRHEAPLAA